MKNYNLNHIRSLFSYNFVKFCNTNNINLNYYQQKYSKLRTKYEGGKKLKATGVVRRIDDLGRVVIPKEIRKTLHIKEGDPLETTLEQMRILISSLQLTGAGR